MSASLPHGVAPYPSMQRAISPMRYQPVGTGSLLMPVGGAPPQVAGTQPGLSPRSTLREMPGKAGIHEDWQTSAARQNVYIAAPTPCRPTSPFRKMEQSSSTLETQEPRAAMVRMTSVPQKDHINCCANSQQNLTYEDQLDTYALMRRQQAQQQHEEQIDDYVRMRRQQMERQLPPPPKQQHPTQALQALESNPPHPVPLVSPRIHDRVIRTDAKVKPPQGATGQASSQPAPLRSPRIHDRIVSADAKLVEEQQSQIEQLQKKLELLQRKQAIAIAGREGISCQNEQQTQVANASAQSHAHPTKIPTRPVRQVSKQVDATLETKEQMPDVAKMLGELERLDNALAKERRRNDELEALEKQREMRFAAELEKQHEIHKSDVGALEAIVHKVVHQNELLSSKLSSFAALGLLEKSADLGTLSKEGSTGSTSDSGLGDAVHHELEGSTSEGSMSDAFVGQTLGARPVHGESPLSSDISLTCSATHSDDNLSEPETRSIPSTAKDGTSSTGSTSPPRADSPPTSVSSPDNLRWKHFQ